MFQTLAFNISNITNYNCGCLSTVNHMSKASFELNEYHIETVSLEGTFCDTVQVPCGVGDTQLL